jgi:hypothetical protein
MNFDPSISPPTQDNSEQPSPVVSNSAALIAKLSKPIHSYWQWWTGELSALIPNKWRDFGGPAKIDLAVKDDGLFIGSIRQNKLTEITNQPILSELSSDHWQQIADQSSNRVLRLVLNENDLLKIHIELPRSGGGLKQLAALQIPVLSPLDPKILYWNVISSPKKITQKNYISATIVAARKDVVENIEQIFAEHELMPPEICGVEEEQIVALKKPLRIAANADGKHKWILPILISVLLISIPISTVFLSDKKRANIDQLTTQLENRLAPKIAAMKEARKIGNRQKILAPVAYNPAITPLFDAIAARLDSNSKITSAQREGDGSVIVDIETSNPDAVQTALSELPFHQIRAARKGQVPNSPLFTLQLEIAAK